MHTWSHMRVKLEKDYLAPALRGRITYFVTTYNKCHDREGRAAIRLDGEEIKKSSYFDVEKEIYKRTRKIQNNGKSNFECWK